MKKKLLVALTATATAFCSLFGFAACGDTPSGEIREVAKENILHVLVDFGNAITTAENFSYEMTTETVTKGKLPINGYIGQTAGTAYKINFLKAENGYCYDYTYNLENAHDDWSESYTYNVYLRGDKLYTPTRKEGEYEAKLTAGDYTVELGTQDAFFTDTYLLQSYMLNAELAYMYSFFAGTDAEVLSETLKICEKSINEEDGFIANVVAETFLDRLGFNAEEYSVTDYKAYANSEKTVKKSSNFLENFI